MLTCSFNSVQTRPPHLCSGHKAHVLVANTIENNHFSGIYFDGDDFVGTYYAYSSIRISLFDNVISNNGAGGVRLRQDEMLYRPILVVGNTISNNEGGAYAHGAALTVAMAQAPDSHHESFGTALIKGNTIAGNSHNTGLNSTAFR